VRHSCDFFQECLSQFGFAFYLDGFKHFGHVDSNVQTISNLRSDPGPTVYCAIEKIMNIFT
jgi:hypothetical protein